MTERRDQARALALGAAWVWCGPGELRREAWVVMEGGRVRELVSSPPAGMARRKLGPGLLMPGLVNAHTHLELSFLAGRVPPAGDFVEWVQRLVAARPAYDRGRAARAARQAARAAASWGTVLAGDISNTGKAAWAWQEAGISSLTLREALGPARGEPPPPWSRWQGRVLAAGSVAAHAPYSVPGRRLRKLKQRAGKAVFCIHLAESRAEMEFFAGRGERGRRLERFLEQRGLVRSELGILAPRPLAHLEALGLVDERTLLVHGVQLEPGEIERLARAGSSLCLCPRSNLGLTGSLAPLPRLLAAGVNLALGTDSLASAPDLSLWAEMALLRRRFPQVDPEAILTMATLGGARALGLAQHFGRLAPGRLGPLVMVPLEASRGREVLEAAVAGTHAAPPYRVG